jgi:hypothetical protein
LEDVSRFEGEGFGGNTISTVRIKRLAAFVAEIVLLAKVRQMSITEHNK